MTSNPMKALSANTCKSTLSPLNASLNCVSIFFSESTSIDAPTNRNETRALRAKKLFHFFQNLQVLMPPH